MEGIAHMKTLLLAACTIFGCVGTLPAAAAGLCNCCGVETAAHCAAACAAVKPSPGQCVATIDFAAKVVIAEGQNPLYDIPLQNVWLGSPTRDQLEALRILLEAARRSAEMDRRRALRAAARGEITAEDAQRLAKRYDSAIINYYLGMKAYRQGFAQDG